MAIYINGVKIAGRGQPGKSPYQVAMEGGYTGTEDDFNTQLVNIGQAAQGFTELKAEVENAKNEIDQKVDEALAQFPNSENLATKTYVDEKITNIDLSNYYKKSETYNKTETSNAISIATASMLTNVWYYGASKPSNTKLLWIDSNATTGGLKYHNGTDWVHVPVAWT